jgi:hypothetical protein
MHFMATMSFPRSLSTWRSAPAAFGESKRARLHPASHLDSENFKERLGILYDLVFELRREMADLKFRLQATKDNVATFLHILTTMQEELASGPVGSSPGEAPDMAMDSTRRQAVDRQKEGERNGPVEDEVHVERNEQRKEDQLANVETEPWIEDLRATWLGF